MDGVPMEGIGQRNGIVRRELRHGHANWKMRPPTDDIDRKPLGQGLDKPAHTHTSQPARIVWGGGNAPEYHQWRTRALGEVGQISSEESLPQAVVSACSGQDLVLSRSGTGQQEMAGNNIPSSLLLYTSVGRSRAVRIPLSHITRSSALSLLAL